MAVYSMLTDVGLSKINNAQPGSIYVEVAYWVAAYDEQLNTDYTTGDPKYKNISNYTTPSDQYPSGNIYWNGLPFGQNPDSLTNPPIENLYTGVSFQPVVDGDAINYKGSWDGSTGVYPTNPTKGDFYTISVAGTIGAYPNDPNGIYYGVGDDMVYNGTAWKNGVEPNRRGNFKVIVEDSTKAMTINKLALYAITRSEDGTIQTNPFLLGQVIIPKAQLIQPRTEADAFSVDQLVVDFQIDTQAVLSNFDNVIYASKEDYWTRVTDNSGQYGLMYDGQVYISNRLGIEDANSGFPVTDDVGVGKALIATYESVNKPNSSEESKLPQLVLQYVKSTVFPVNDTTQNNNAYSPRVRTTFRTTQYGDCEIDLYGSCDNQYGYYSLTPQEDRAFGLGNNSNRWRSLKTSERIETYLGKNYETVNITVKNVSGQTMPAGTSIVIADSKVSPMTAQIATTDANSVGVTTGIIQNGETGTAAIRRDGRWDYIQSSEEGKYHPSNEYGYMVKRNNNFSKNENLGLLHLGNSSIACGPHYDSRDIKNNTSLDYKENYYYMYGNVSNFIAGVESLSGDKYYRDYPLSVRSTADISMYTISKDIVSEYEMEGLSQTSWTANANAVHGEIYNLIEMGESKLTTDFAKRFTGQSGTSTIFDNLFTAAKWATVKDEITNITDARTAMFGSANPTGAHTVTGNGINNDIVLTSSRFIYTFGDMVPMVDGMCNLGASNYRYRDLYIDTIHGSIFSNTSVGNYFDYTGWNLLNIDADIVPYNDTKKISRNLSGQRFDTINCTNIGVSNDYIDNGYITTLSVADELKIAGNTTINSLGFFNNDENFSIGGQDPDDYIAKAYIDELHVNKLIGIDFNTKSKTFTQTLNGYFEHSGGFDGVTVGTTMTAEVVYNISAIKSITLTFTKTIAGGINEGWKLGNTNGSSASFKFGKGAFAKLVDQIKADDDLKGFDPNVYLPLIFANTTQSASKNRSKYGSDYYRLVKSEVSWNGSALENDNFYCYCKKTNAHNLKGSDESFTMDFNSFMKFTFKQL